MNIDSFVSHVKRNLVPEYQAFGRYFADYESAAQHAAGVIQRRTKLARRELSYTELIGGIEREDLRTSAEKVDDANWRPMLPPSDEQPKNWRDAWLEEVKQEESDSHKSTERKMAEKAIREYESRLSEEERQKRFASDPRRLRAIAIAEQQLEEARYSIHSTFRDVVQAEQALDQAKAGDLDHYKAMSKAHAEKYRGYAHAELTAFDEQISQLREAKHQLTNGFEDEDSRVWSRPIGENYEVSQFGERREVRV